MYYVLCIMYYVLSTAIRFFPELSESQPLSTDCTSLVTYRSYTTKETLSGTMTPNTDKCVLSATHQDLFLDEPAW